MFSSLAVKFHSSYNWILTKEFTFFSDKVKLNAPLWRDVGLNVVVQNNGGVQIIVESGFSTDFATTPRILWSIVAPQDICHAAVIHDKMYSLVENTNCDFWVKRSLRHEADCVFWEGLQDRTCYSGFCHQIRCVLCWYAVRFFGWTYVNIPYIVNFRKYEGTKKK